MNGYPLAELVSSVMLLRSQEEMNAISDHGRSLDKSGNNIAEYDNHVRQGFFRCPMTSEDWKRFKEKRIIWETEDRNWRMEVKCTS
jgi:hypothetical protein